MRVIDVLLHKGGLTMIMLVTTDVYVLINYTSFVEATFVAAAVGGLLWLRRKRPDVPRPIKVKLIYFHSNDWESNCISFTWLTGEFGVPDSVFRGVHFSRLLPGFFKSDGSRHGHWNHHYSRSGFLPLHSPQKQTEMDLIS